MRKIDSSKWEYYRLNELFEIKNTHSVLKRAVVENSGNVPYVTASNENNGIYSYVEYDSSLMDKGNCILIGGKTMAITYQKEDFISNDSHNLALYLKEKEYADEYIYLFLVTAISASIKHLYSWGDSISKKSIQKDGVYLPALNSRPDWEKMKTIILEVEADTIKFLADLKGVEYHTKKKINIDNWEEFHLYDIFEINAGTKLDKIKMDTTEPEICFVGRSNVNNGITEYVKEIPGIKPFEAGNLTLALGGAYLGSCFIQDRPFYTSQNVNVLIPKHKMSDSAKRFIATAIFIESQNNYQAFVKELNAHVKRDFTIKLPVTSDGKPDYDFMGEYMDNIERKSVNQLKNLTF